MSSDLGWYLLKATEHIAICMSKCPDIFLVFSELREPVPPMRYRHLACNRKLRLLKARSTPVGSPPICTFICKSTFILKFSAATTPSLSYRALQKITEA
ncbi:hypothetical protein L596_009246 [Steinernema carpocapsae]|uniref:Uncharacterized protein n=1 Tax=Steinernema carpocapsae TaxID=34508 RepID=A0A4U5PFB8_STECR|nr:hypothetical protein L596_009246 [Steinernema carpocapsae]